MRRPELVAGPTVEPLSLDIVHSDLRLDPEDDGTFADDPWLTEVGIPAARRACEDFTGRALAPSTWRETLDDFPVFDEIRLSVVPLVRVLSVEVLGAAGVLQVVPPDEYHVDTAGGQAHGRIVPVRRWPTAARVPGAVRVTYEAGSAELDPIVQAAMLRVLGHLYRNREAVSDRAGHVVPLAFYDLLRPHRVEFGI